MKTNARKATTNYLFRSFFSLMKCVGFFTTGIFMLLPLF